VTRGRVLLIVLALSAGCDKNPNPTDPSTTTPTSFSELFAGTLASRASSFYSFATAQTETVGVTLASITQTATGPALTTVMTLGLGTPSGTGCALTTSQTVGPALAAQISTSINAGTYCVSIADIGNLPASADFVIRITHTFTAPTTTNAPKTDVFISALSVHGSSSKSFSATQAGTVTITLDNTSPASAIGLGLGLFRADGGGCSLSRSVNTAAGATAQISTAVDPGTYCVKVFDIGTLIDPINFSITIVHP
jgi:hypothetical protein